MKPQDIMERLGSVKENISEVIVGLEDVTEMMLVSMICGGHILLEGPPGLGKTTLAKTFAQTIGGVFNRIQMTSDLLPSDILGINVYNPHDSTWILRRGPIFGNVVLIDELNRSSPKVQSAFLQVMQERQVTIESETLNVPSPFMMIATQVPIGEVGTYPLTNVQIDRFAFRFELDYHDAKTEMEILRRVDSIETGTVESVVSNDDILEIMGQVKQVHIEEILEQYIVDLVQGIRNNEYVRLGPSTRASIWLLHGSRALALVNGRNYVIPDDIKKLVKHVIPHRVELSQEARFQDIKKIDLIEQMFQKTMVPKGFD